MSDFIDSIKSTIEPHKDLIKAYTIIVGCLLGSLFIFWFLSNKYDSEIDITSRNYSVTTLEDLKEEKKEADEKQDSTENLNMVNLANDYLSDYYGYNPSEYSSRLDSFAQSIHFEDSASYNELRNNMLLFMSADIVNRVFPEDVVSTNSEGYEVSHIDAQKYEMSVEDCKSVTYKSDDVVRFVSIIEFSNQDGAKFPSTICGTIDDDNIYVDSFTIEPVNN